MVRLFTKNFSKDNAKLILSIIEKGNQLKESIYLNFNDSNVYIFTSKVQVKFPFLWQKDADDLIPQNFFVSAENFLSICDLYEELEVFKDEETSNFGFKSGNETYQFSTFSESVDLSNFEEISKKPPENFSELDENNIGYISMAIKYSDVDAETSPLKAVFLRDKSIISTNRIRKFFNYKTGIDLGNYDIPCYLAKILSTAKKASICDLDNKIYFKLNNLIELVVSKETNLNLPVDVASDEFVTKFDHDTFVIADKKLLLDNLRFLEGYVKDIKNHRVFVEFTENSMIINVKDNNKIKKVIAIESISEEIIGDNFWVDLSILKSICTDIGNVTSIKIKEKQSSPVINIVGNSDNAESSLNLIVIKMVME